MFISKEILGAGKMIQYVNEILYNIIFYLTDSKCSCY